MDVRNGRRSYDVDVQRTLRLLYIRPRMLILVVLLALLVACAGPGGARPSQSVTPVTATTAASPTTAVSVRRTQPATAAVQSPAPTASDSGADWLRFGFDPARSGVNPGETALTPATVGGLRRLWRTALPGVADSSPILLHALPVAGRTRDVLYVTTRDGRLIALDAAQGTILWSRQPQGPKITHSSPVAGPDRRFVYAYGLDGALHRYAAATGEETGGNGWPVPITRMRETEKESSALNIADNHIYVTTSGYIGDAPPYQGHIVAVDPATGTASVFNSLCSNIMRLLVAADCPSNQSGIWARAGAVVDPATGNVFATTGNGPFDADHGGHDYGDSVVELSADVRRVLDSYTPTTYQELDSSDADLGSTAPALLPDLRGSKTPRLLVQGGKDGQLRLINRQNLSGAGGPGHVGGEIQALESAGCATFTQPVVWTGPDGTVWVFVAGTCRLAAYRAETDSAGASSLRLAWKAEISATTPVLAGCVLFAATSGAVVALDPATSKQLWSSTQPGAGGTIGGIHWQSPIVIGGKLYVSDEDGALYAYGLR